MCILQLDHRMQLPQPTHRAMTQPALYAPPATLRTVVAPLALNVRPVNERVACGFHFRGMMEDVRAGRARAAVRTVQLHHLRPRGAVISAGRNLDDDLRLVVGAGTLGDLN